MVRRLRWTAGRPSCAPGRRAAQGAALWAAWTCPPTSAAATGLLWLSAACCAARMHAGRAGQQPAQHAWRGCVLDARRCLQAPSAASDGGPQRDAADAGGPPARRAQRAVHAVLPCAQRPAGRGRASLNCSPCAARPAGAGRLPAAGAFQCAGLSRPWTSQHPFCPARGPACRSWSPPGCRWLPRTACNGREQIFRLSVRRSQA